MYFTKSWKQKKYYNNTRRQDNSVKDAHLGWNQGLAVTDYMTSDKFLNQWAFVPSFTQQEYLTLRDY